MAEFEWEWEPEPSALRRAIRHQLRSLDRSLRILAEEFLASESTIDLLALGGEGELVSIRIGSRGDDPAMLTRSLSDLVWLGPRARDLRQLLPELAIEGSADARSILLCPEFGGETRAAIENFPSHRIELMVYRCYRHRGQLDVILEPLKQQQKQQQKQKQENPPRLPGQEERCDGRPQQRSPRDREALPAGAAGQGAVGGDPGQGPDPLLNRVLTSTFRTGLSDVDLRLEAEENHGRG